MVPACAPILSCQDRELHYQYSFNGSHYTAPEVHIEHYPEPYPVGVYDHYAINVQAGNFIDHTQDSHTSYDSQPASPNGGIDVHDLCKNGPV